MTGTGLSRRREKKTTQEFSAMLCSQRKREAINSSFNLTRIFIKVIQ